MLQATQLQFERHFDPVFAPVDLAVAAGELWLVTGANGAGKTTLIRLLAGLLRPSAGHVDVRAERMAYLGHQLGLKDDLTVEENLRFHAALGGGAARGGKDLNAAIQTVGLDLARFQAVRTLSAGQRKRCALARLLLCPAPLWLLDEPYANLDAQGVALVDTLLAKQVQSGGACIMSTHGALRPPDLPYRELVVKAPVLVDPAVSEAGVSA
ncbi:MAG: heme ABC exporter ATP-binding protein CcmA [Xanthomonadales bacterium]|jgi:heme exporter protein A|nr:heme ABC exporter ATP-binding protein CcmA [Xanthomonadales bacterium]